MVKKKPVTKKKTDALSAGFNTITRTGGFTYLGNDLSSLGKVIITLNTFYQILKDNTEAQAGKNLIVKMVGKEGIKLWRNGKVFEDPKLYKEIIDFFTDPITGSWRGHRDKYFTNMFCAGQVYGYKATDGLGKPRDIIMDSRDIKKDTDNFGIAKGYSNKNGEVYPADKVTEQITNYDPDFPIYGHSIFNSVVYNALSDLEAQKRNYYFFKNNATPHLFVILKESIQNPEELQSSLEQFKAKYTDPSQSGPILSNSDIADVKDISTKNTDLQLLELSRFAVAKMGVVYGINPKLFGWAGNEFGSYTEFEQMAMQGDDVLSVYADYYEDYLNATFKKFVNPNMDFEIEVLNESFLDKTYKNKWVVDLVDAGLLSRAEGRQKLGESTEGLPEEMSAYTIKNDRVNITDINKMADIAKGANTTPGDTKTKSP